MQEISVSDSSSRFLFRASLLSEPVLVIFAVAATFSALTVLYLNFNNRLKKKNSQQLSGIKDSNSHDEVELTKQGKGFEKLGIKNEILELGKDKGETHVKEIEPIIEKNNLNGYIYEESVVQYQKTKESEFNGSDVVPASSAIAILPLLQRIAKKDGNL